MTTIKTCTHCRTAFTAEAWRALPLVGYADDGTELLELRNCTCQPRQPATLAIATSAASPHARAGFAAHWLANRCYRRERFVVAANLLDLAEELRGRAFRPDAGPLRSLESLEPAALKVAS